MKIPALIFARMDSTRLPGKATKSLAGVPVLTRVVDRVRRAQQIDGVVICTTERGIDDPIAALARDLDVDVFRGATTDVLGRAVAAANGADAVVRISGDSAFIDPQLIDRVTAHHRQHRPDLTTNVHPRTFPPGMSVEVISTSTLARIDRTVQDQSDREHVTTYLYRNDATYVIDNVAADEPMTDVDLALDTPDDFAFQSRLAPHVKSDANVTEIVREARRLAADMMEPAP